MHWHIAKQSGFEGERFWTCQPCNLLYNEADGHIRIGSKGYKSLSSDLGIHNALLIEQVKKEPEERRRHVDEQTVRISNPDEVKDLRWRQIEMVAERHEDGRLRAHALVMLYKNRSIPHVRDLLRKSTGQACVGMWLLLRDVPSARVPLQETG